MIRLFPKVVKELFSLLLFLVVLTVSTIGNMKMDRFCNIIQDKSLVWVCEKERAFFYYDPGLDHGGMCGVLYFQGEPMIVNLYGAPYNRLDIYARPDGQFYVGHYTFRFSRRSFTLHSSTDPFFPDSYRVTFKAVRRDKLPWFEDWLKHGTFPFSQ